MASTSTHEAAESSLVTVVRLLHTAANLAWTQAEVEGPWSIWHVRGLGAYIVACQATALLSGDVQTLAVPVAHPATGEMDPLALVRAAYGECGAVPIDAWPPGGSAVVVAVADVVREWTPRP